MFQFGIIWTPRWGERIEEQEKIDRGNLVLEFYPETVMIIIL